MLARYLAGKRGHFLVAASDRSHHDPGNVGQTTYLEGADYSSFYLLGAGKMRQSVSAKMSLSLTHSLTEDKPPSRAGPRQLSMLLADAHVSQRGTRWAKLLRPPTLAPKLVCAACVRACVCDATCRLTFPGCNSLADCCVVWRTSTPVTQDRRITAFGIEGPAAARYTSTQAASCSSI